MKEDKVYEFKCIVERCVYNSKDFKIYGVKVDEKLYPDIKHNKYKNVSISGNISELTPNVEYSVTATETESKYGVGYKVKNISRDVPVSEQGTLEFLREILTVKQAETLYNVYPDIIQRVKENRLDDIDLSKTKGIKEYTFNVIKQKIIENFCLTDLVAEFKGYLGLNTIRKIYCKYSDVGKVREALRERPYKALCSLSGVGFKSADAILLEIEKVSKSNIEKNEPPIINFTEDLKTSLNRCLSCILYLLEENEKEGHTKYNLVELRKKVLELTPECIDKFSEALKDASIFYDKEELFVIKKETYNREVYVATTICETLNNSKEWNCDIEKYRIVDGATLSDEQINAVSNLAKYNVSILNGAAGSGKSFSTKAVLKYLKDMKKSYKLFSPTGKAAKVLSEYTNEIATTIHRGLMFNPQLDYPWTYNKENKLCTDVVIVDEFSMTDLLLFTKLIDAIDFNKTKIMLIGDNAQLPSVGAGNLMHDMMESGIIPTTTLTKIFRYGEGGLMKVATDVRFCQPYLDKSMKNTVTAFGNKDYTYVDLSSDAIPKNAVGLYNKLLKSGYSVSDIQVLTAKNVGDCGTATLNNMIQRVANKNFGSEVCVKSGDVVYYKGDLIIQKVNNYNAKLYKEDIDNIFDDNSAGVFVANGETGIIVDIVDNKDVVIDFDGIKVKYSKAELNTIGLGYCITIHKSQGSSSKVIILLTPQSHTFMINSNLIYVGLTRMKEKCFHLGSLNTVNNAIKKKANLERHTCLKELLKNK